MAETALHLFAVAHCVFGWCLSQTGKTKAPADGGGCKCHNHRCHNLHITSYCCRSQAGLKEAHSMQTAYCYKHTILTMQRGQGAMLRCACRTGTHLFVLRRLLVFGLFCTSRSRSCSSRSSSRRTTHPSDSTTHRHLQSHTQFARSACAQLASTTSPGCMECSRPALCTHGTGIQQHAECMEALAPAVRS